MARIVVFGGYGAVGREAAAVPARSHEVVVAGRNPAKSVPGATTMRVDLRDDADVERALDGAYAVVMCAEVDNVRVARACLERGVHYLDVTASHRTLAAIQSLEGGATALLSVGLAPGVTNLPARHCVELTGARDVGIGVLLSGGERHGAAAVAWTLDGLAELGPSWRVPFPHVDQVVDPVGFLTEVAGHGFDLHPPTMRPDGTATSSSTA